jgi:pimeloyl-ACP methyl ester carboxylesterase
MRSGVNGFESLDDAAAAIAAYTPQRKRATNPEGLKKVLRERDGKWFWHWDPKVITHDRTEVVANRFLGLLDVAMGNILVPTLLVRGELSDVVTQAGIDLLVSRLPDITVVEVAGAAHMIAGDQNDEFTSAVNSFLDDRIRPLVAKRA